MKSKAAYRRGGRIYLAACSIGWSAAAIWMVMVGQRALSIGCLITGVATVALLVREDEGR